MTRFSKVLSDLLTEKDLTQRDLGLACGMLNTKISRLCAATTRPSSEDILALLGAFPDSKDRYRLALAHIQDEVPAQALAHVDIQPVEAYLREPGPLLPAELPSGVERSLRYLISQMPENPGIAEVFMGMAHALGLIEPPLLPQLEVKYPVAKKPPKA